jgi:hypothetical protein
MQGKKFAIVTAVLNEHDYLNYFIECYVGVGFHKFYVLIDNSTCEQMQYKLKPEFVPLVKFVHITEIFDQKGIQHRLQHFKHKSGLIHEALQIIFTRLVKEDYVMLAGIDSLLYLNEKTIQQYFQEKRIDDSFGLVFFHWIICVNTKYTDTNYNLVNYINTENSYKSGSDHFFTLCNKKHVIRPSHDSHHYELAHPVKAWYNDDVYTIHPKDMFWKISKEILKVNSSTVRPHPCILHFIARSVNDVLIKYYNQWSNNDPNAIEKRRVALRNVILYKSNDREDYDGKLNFLNYSGTDMGHLNIQTNYAPFDVHGNDALIRKLLSECEIPYDKYLEWIETKGFLQ